MQYTFFPIYYTHKLNKTLYSQTECNFCIASHQFAKLTLVLHISDASRSGFSIWTYNYRFT